MYNWTQLSTNLQVNIHDPLIPAELISEGVEVEPGYVTTILVTPTQEVMDGKGNTFIFLS